MVPFEDAVRMGSAEGHFESPEARRVVPRGSNGFRGSIVLDVPRSRTRGEGGPLDYDREVTAWKPTRDRAHRKVPIRFGSFLRGRRHAENDTIMKTRNKKNDLRPEYDFSRIAGGVRGKYAKAYQAGTNIAVLADDVALAFPTDDSVNRALRAVMDAANAMPGGMRPPNKRLKVTKGRHRSRPRTAKR